LQNHALDIGSATAAASDVQASLQRMREPAYFEPMWNECLQIGEKFDFAAPQSPRYRRAPRRLDDGQLPYSFPDAKSHFRQQFIDAVDSVIGQMERRFEQPALHLYDSMAKVLLNSFKGIPYEDGVVERICGHFGDDIDQSALNRQLQCLQDARRLHTPRAMAEPNGDCELSLADVIACLHKLGPQIDMFREVKTFLELFLLLPVTSAAAERSFSGLRRLKTFLRTSMSQELLNSLAILHVHKRLTRELDVIKAAKEFVGRSQYRLSSFGSFT
jgi:hypothetical protein